MVAEDSRVGAGTATGGEGVGRVVAFSDEGEVEVEMFVDAGMLSNSVRFS